MTDRLVSEERIAELAASVFEEIALQASEPFDPEHWSVPSMTFEDAAQRLAALIRTAIQEAGEAAMKVCDEEIAMIARYDKQRKMLSERGCLGRVAAEISKRLPKPPEVA